MRNASLMLSGRKRVRARLFGSGSLCGPSMPVRSSEKIAMYGFASGAMERTSMRADFSLPSGMRIIEPRSVALALIWFGAS